MAEITRRSVLTGLAALAAPVPAWAAVPVMYMASAVLPVVAVRPAPAVLPIPTTRTQWSVNVHPTISLSQYLDLVDSLIVQGLPGCELAPGYVAVCDVYDDRLALVGVVRDDKSKRWHIYHPDDAMRMGLILAVPER